MAIEMREDSQIVGVALPIERKTIISLSHHKNQSDNIHDRLSMFADDRSIIITSTDQVKAARENIHSYERALYYELHEGKTIVIKLGKARRKKLHKRQSMLTLPS